LLGDRLRGAADPQVRQPDITRARQLLGWESGVEVREGLRRTIEGKCVFRTRRRLVASLPSLPLRLLLTLSCLPLLFAAAFVFRALLLRTLGWRGLPWRWRTRLAGGFLYGLFDGSLNVFLGRGVVAQFCKSLGEQDLYDCPQEDDEGRPHLGAEPLDQWLQGGFLSSYDGSRLGRAHDTGAGLSEDRLKAEQPRPRQTRSGEYLDRVTDYIERAVRNLRQLATTRAVWSDVLEGNAPCIVYADVGAEDEAAHGAKRRERNRHGNSLGRTGGLLETAFEYLVILAVASTLGSLVGAFLVLVFFQ
jgi:hypothetical protein